MDLTNQQTEAIRNSAILNMYNVPQIEQNNWNKWLENCFDEDKSVIQQVRDISIRLSNAGFRTIIVPLPPDPDERYWIDYPYDYFDVLYPNNQNNNIIIIILKLDVELHVKLEQRRLYANHTISNLQGFRQFIIDNDLSEKIIYIDIDTNIVINLD